MQSPAIRIEVSHSLKPSYPFWRSLAAVITLAGCVAFPAVFSTLAGYDDEGYCMMTLRFYAEGERLYGAIHTQYGPAYYALMHAIHEGLNWPLTQSGVRCKTCFVWMFAAAITFVITSRLTRSRLVSFATALLLTIHLDKLALEPGHPQEIILIGSLLIAWLVLPSQSENPESTRWIGWFCAGIIAALVGLTKLNCGMVVAIPLLVASAAGLSQGLTFRWLLACMASLPGLMIAWMARSDATTSVWALWIAVSSVLFVAKRVHMNEFARHWRAIAAVATGGLVGCLVIIVRTLWEGTTWNELLFGIVGQHADFAADFFQPLPWTNGAALGVLGVTLSIGVKSLAGRRHHVWFELGILGLIVGCLASSVLQPLQHGLLPRGVGIFLAWFVPGWVAWGLNEELSRQRGLFVMGLLAILAPLTAFPVSGTQVEIGTVPGFLLIAISLGRRWTSSLSHPAAHDGDRFRLPLKLLASVIGSLFLLSCVGHWSRYGSGESLVLPGSFGMRLPASVVREQLAIAAAIKATQAETLVFEGHNNNRFFFWTGTSPATTISPTFWPRMITSKEQQHILDRLNRPGKYCVVRVPDYQLFYDVRTEPLQQRLREGWRKEASIGDWEIGVVDVQ